MGSRQGAEWGRDSRRRRTRAVPSRFAIERGEDGWYRVRDRDSDMVVSYAVTFEVAAQDAYELAGKRR